MDGVRLFDAHCYTGRYKTFLPGSFTTTKELLEQMDHFDIAEALVTSTLSREHHPLEGNATILVETASSDRLHPCWALLPPRSGELPQPRALLEEMLAQDVRAVRLFYRTYEFPLSEWCLGPLLEQLEARAVATILDPDTELVTWEPDRFDWDAVDALCGEHPQLPVILSGARFRTSNRLLYALLDRHDNLHIELSGYWGYGGIEFITREFGARRLVFGTRMPARDPGCAISQLLYADIAEQDRKLIAGDNLRSLLGGAR